MPSNGSWDLIRRLKVNWKDVVMIRHNDLQLYDTMVKQLVCAYWHLKLPSKCHFLELKLMRNFRCHFNNPTSSSGTAGIPMPFTTATSTVKCLWGATPNGVQMGTNILKESPASRVYLEEEHMTFIWNSGTHYQTTRHDCPDNNKYDIVLKWKLWTG